MSVKYEVWSEPFESAPQLEVTRTDKKVALDDAALIRSILHRSAEVRETGADGEDLFAVEAAA